MVASRDSRPTVLSADTVVVGERVLSPGWVAVDGGVVVGGDPGAPPGEPAGPHATAILPGYVDLHAHGAVGHDFGSADAGGVAEAARHHARRGTTTLVASVATAPLDVLVERCAMLREHVEGGLLAGIHLEGPYLSPERRGAHARDLLRRPDVAEVERLLEAGGGAIRMVTLAPELPGAEEVTRLLVAGGVTVAVGHTACTAQEAEAALGWGATVLTHAFNGMPPLHHREAGPLGVGLLHERMTVELVLDGHHVGREAVEVARRAAGSRLALVSDAMAATGLGDGEFTIAGSSVVVEGGVAMLADRSSLAGSTITMSDAVARLVDVHAASWVEVAQAASVAPARALGLPDPSIGVGRRADLVLVQGSATVAVVSAGRRVD